MQIEFATDGMVSRQELRPDLNWAQAAPLTKAVLSSSCSVDHKVKHADTMRYSGTPSVNPSSIGGAA